MGKSCVIVTLLVLFSATVVVNSSYNGSTETQTATECKNFVNKINSFLLNHKVLNPYIGNDQSDYKQNGGRWLFVLRHGERMDYTFGDWVPLAFNEHGQYKRLDLNFPPTLPKRDSGPSAYTEDCPLTMLGRQMARLVGEGMRDTGVPIQHVYSSPALRCVETATSFLQGFGVDGDNIKIEPGLFEWLGFRNMTPEWISPSSLHEFGYPVDTSYSPYFKIGKKPFLPLGDDSIENCIDFSTRYESTVLKILRDTQSTGGNVLLVGHACSGMETRNALQGDAMQPMEVLGRMKYLPYCAFAAFRSQPWRVVPAPIPPLLIAGSNQYNWTFLDPIDTPITDIY